MCIRDSHHVFRKRSIIVVKENFMIDFAWNADNVIAPVQHVRMSHQKNAPLVEIAIIFSTTESVYRNVRCQHMLLLSTVSNLAKNVHQYARIAQDQDHMNVFHALRI
eukprot:TRINITY_DN18443_c0_g1_i1.p2 TRINITY_DN18443_c0_g1~~TRINITY_DN18443_c0_g1_i1.p2  ORF type:complete len:107 (+),score=10.09 TRINITY_DN18443_c0_g1_i1:54-374(+)